MIEAIKKLEAAAATLLQHPVQGQSPFAGPLRSALSRAAELAAEHDKWAAANAEKKPAPAAK